jgi:biotin transport system substrate-specific component
MILGLAGLPVFSSGGGLAYIFRPSFGYIIGFVAAAFITGVIARKFPDPSFKRLLAASLAGIAVIYLIGMVYFYLISNYVINSPIDLKALFIYCFAVTVPGT